MDQSFLIRNKKRGGGAERPRTRVAGKSFFPAAAAPEKRPPLSPIKKPSKAIRRLRLPRRHARRRRLPLAEPVLEPARQVLHVAHPPGARGPALDRFLAPLVGALARGRVAARRAGGLLHVVGAAAAAAAERVGLVVPATCLLSWLVFGLVWRCERGRRRSVGVGVPAVGVRFRRRFRRLLTERAGTLAALAHGCCLFGSSSVTLLVLVFGRLEKREEGRAIG